MAESKGVDVAEVVALYEAGRTLKQVADELGVNLTTVRKHSEPPSGQSCSRSSTSSLRLCQGRDDIRTEVADPNPGRKKRKS